MTEVSAKLTISEALPEFAGNRSITFSPNVQYLRGVAALSVMLYHAGIWYDKAFNFPLYKQIFPGIFGLYGVAVFFAISGFLMAELIQKQDPSVFLGRRIARIYPMVIFATVISLLIRVEIWPYYSFASLTLAPVMTPTYPLGIEWSLVNEVFFYVGLFFVSLIGLRRHVPLVASIWLLGIGINAGFGISHPTIGFANLPNLVFMVENAPFAGGLLIPTLIQRNPPKALLLVLFVVSVLFALGISTLALNRVVSGIGCVCLVAFAVQSKNLLSGWTEIAFNKLGDWSFALYLIHTTVFRGVFSGSIDEIAPWTFGLWLATAMAAAIALGEFDLYFSRMIRSAVPTKKKRALNALLVAFLAVYFGTALTHL